MTDVSKKVFALFAEISGFSTNKATEYYNFFIRSSMKKMESFVNSKVIDHCKTPFLKSLLLRLSRVYDEPKLRDQIASIINENCISLGIKGDFHVHTNWSDGYGSINDVVKKAEKLGYKYIAITDHSLIGKGKVEMNSEKFIKQLELIDRLQHQAKVKIFKGIEIDINDNGKLDYPDQILDMTDLVLGAVHFDYGKGPERALELFEILCSNPYVDIIAHPLNKIGIDCFHNHLDRIIDLVKTHNKILEINLFPDRIRENDELVKYLKGTGIKLCFGTDSHSPKQLELMKLSRLWIDELDDRSIANFYEDPLAFFHHTKKDKNG